MAVFLLSVLAQVGFVMGSHYGFVEWSEHESQSEMTAKQPIFNTPINNQEPHNSLNLLKPAIERSVSAHKIEEDLPRVVTAFLHTGDSSTLKHANCSRRYELSSLRDRSYMTSNSSLHSVLDTVVHATNFLNMILQANSSRMHNPRRDIEWYHALVRSILEGDSKIYRAVVTFNAESPSSVPHVFLQATRTDGGIVLQDLSTTAHHHQKNKTADTEWFSEIRSRRKPNLHRRVLSQEIKSADASLRRGESYILDKTQIKWSAPFLECENGNFIPQWLLTLSAGFYGLKPNLAPEFRGVIRADVNLQNVDIDQCSSSGWFAGTHRCNLTSTECMPIHGRGFVLDKYKCQCRKGFYHPNRVSVNGFKRKEKGKDASEGPHGDDPWEGSSECLPCREGCVYCKDDAPCYAQGDSYLRIAVISFQGLCMLVDFISMVVAYNFRRNKSIRASGLVLLEAILFGALLLYFPVIILYFQPSVFRCILLRWVRLLGFATVYGTVTLKLYRVLKVFLSRTAQRIPYMTSWRVLRLLGIIMLVVCWFLVAWTSAVCQNLDRNLSLIDVGFTPEGLQFSMCLLDRWDYMMAIAESLFLLWAVYLCYAVRTVPSAFHEPRYMAVAVYNELILSAVFHTIRFTLTSGLHPDWMLMLSFAHTHLTVTVTLGLMLIPKFLFAGSHTRDDIATEAYEDELDMGRSGSYLNSSITSAWSEHSLDPEDIREELKKLYAQLEVYKRKKMLANNPHLQKKRSSKKGLGRSLMRRITEIPETMSRQCSREDKDSVDHGANRNSICTLRKNPFDASHASKLKEDSLKNKVFSLKKSHSSYDHVRDQSEDSSSSATDKMEVSTTENSLLDALMGKKLAKKRSAEKIETESTESVPLVCKSASAHNLTADKKPIHPRTSMLQKSLSVIASAKERTLGLTGKMPGVDDSGKKAQKVREGKMYTEKEERPECYSKMIVSQSVEYKQTTSKAGIMKHQVSGSQPAICSDPGKNKDLYDLSEVCPWEVEDLPTPSEGRAQKHVSIAPGETTSVHGSGTKGKSQHKQRASEQSPANSRHSSHKIDKSEVCPWEEESGNQDLVEGSRPKMSIQPSQSHPAVEADKSQRSHICPWEFEEIHAKGVEMAQSLDKARHRKNGSPVGGKEESLPFECTKPATGLQTLHDSPMSPSSNKNSSPPQVSKAKDPATSKRGGASTQTLEVKREKDDERGQSKGKGKSSSNMPAGKRVSQPKIADVCPWEVGGSEEESSTNGRKGSTGELGATQNKQADICPWDFQVVSDSKPDKNVSAAKQNVSNSKGRVAGNSRLADVCPWDFDSETSGKNA